MAKGKEKVVPMAKKAAATRAPQFRANLVQKAQSSRKLECLNFLPIIPGATPSTPVKTGLGIPTNLLYFHTSKYVILGHPCLQDQQTSLCDQPLAITNCVPIISLQNWRFLSHLSPASVLARHHGPGQKGTTLPLIGSIVKPISSVKPIQWACLLPGAEQPESGGREQAVLFCTSLSCLHKPLLCETPKQTLNRK